MGFYKVWKLSFDRILKLYLVKIQKVWYTNMKNQKMEKFIKLIIETLDNVFILSKEEKIGIYRALIKLDEAKIHEIMKTIHEFKEKQNKSEKTLINKINLLWNWIEEIIEKKQLENFNFDI